MSEALENVSNVSMHAAPQRRMDRPLGTRITSTTSGKKKRDDESYFTTD